MPDRRTTAELVEQLIVHADTASDIYLKRVPAEGTGPLAFHLGVLCGLSRALKARLELKNEPHAE